MSADLIERLRKRAKEDQTCADNSAVIVEALAGQMKLFEDRDEQRPWNTYAVRMAVDHRNSVRRDAQFAADLTEAADALAAKDTALSEMRAELEQWQTVKHSSHWKERATAAETELSEAKNVLTLLLCVDFDRFTEHDELLLDTVLADAKAFLAARAASQDEGEER